MKCGQAADRPREPRARARYMAAPHDLPGYAASVAPEFVERQSRRADMRVIGMDISRAFAELVALEDGWLKRMGRVLQ